MKVKYYLDTRRTMVDGTCPLKLSIRLSSQRILLSVGVAVPPRCWSGDAVINHPLADSLNHAIAYKRNLVESYLLPLELSGELATLRPSHLKSRLDSLLTGRYVAEESKELVKVQFEAFLKYKTRQGTIDIYAQTLAKIGHYYDIRSLRLRDITFDWLKEWESQMLRDGLAPNSVAIHLRHLRAVYNNAIDSDIIDIKHYPFRRFKIRQQPTAKRSLTIEELRTLRDYPVEPHQEICRDTFLLIFYLLGINLTDLLHLKKVDNGRITYTRAKTHKLYSIAVPPEAMAIINKYRGEGYLLCWLDRYANHKDAMRTINRNLQNIGQLSWVENRAKELRHRKRNRKQRTPLFPSLTTYWARHTWATIAADLDIPDETISMALGHAGTNRVTDIYINRNQRKVDEANRRIIAELNKKTSPEGEAN